MGYIGEGINPAQGVWDILMEKGSTRPKEYGIYWRSDPPGAMSMGYIGEGINLAQ